MGPSNRHHIQKHILNVLRACKWARFRDMKPANVDSNLYNYHLKLLVTEGMVQKVEGKGYRLSPSGLRFIDHVSLQSFEPRWQPKLLTKVISINNRNEILLWPKYKQPFIDKWSLPSGKMHYDDESVEAAVLREIAYLSPEPPRHVRHRGVVEYKVFIDRELVTHTVAHLFSADMVYDGKGRSRYIPLGSVDELELSPGTKECIRDVLTHDEFFFTSYDINY